MRRTFQDFPRFSGGAVGFAGYDTVRFVELLPHPPEDDRHLPDLCFAFYDRMVIFSRMTRRSRSWPTPTWAETILHGAIKTLAAGWTD